MNDSVSALPWQPCRRGEFAIVRYGSQEWRFIVKQSGDGRWRTKVVLLNRGITRSVFCDKVRAKNDCELRYALLLADYNRERNT